MTSERKLLYVDDDKDNLTTLRRVLRGAFDVTTAMSGSEAIARMEREPFEVLVADQRMPQMTGVELLKETSKRWPDTVGLLLTAYADLDALVDGVNAGVIYRYLTKPWQEADLQSALRQAFERFDLVRKNKILMEELKKTNRVLRDDIAGNFDLSSLLAGSDNGLKSVSQLISKVAPTASSVLVRGESGAGKELVARAIHELSPRKEKAFVRVNCAALTETLLESELFGHEKGAFTGAAERRIGRFEAADGGTLFLDEIGDVSPKLQVSLLRVLQEREFERVGGNQPVKVDVRVIAATHQDLEARSKNGTFRQDLYFRLNVFPIRIPPLRERMEDLPALTARLLERAAKNTGLAAKKLSEGSFKKLCGYDWPGNVRELENILERALILSSGNEIAEDDLALGPGLDSPVQPTADAAELSKEKIEEVIRDCAGNKLEAARRLGIKRPTLYYHMKRLGIA